MSRRSTSKVTGQRDEGQRSTKHEGGTYENHDGQHDNDAVQRSPFKHTVNDVIHGIHEPAGPDTVPERDTAHGQEHDCPRKLLKVILRINKPTSAGDITSPRVHHTFFRTPVAKKATIGMIAMIPMSPIVSWI